MNDKFQKYMRQTIFRSGFRAGPVKNQERCVAKLETDYALEPMEQPPTADNISVQTSEKSGGLPTAYTPRTSEEAPNGFVIHTFFFCFFFVKVSISIANCLCFIIFVCFFCFFFIFVRLYRGFQKQIARFRDACVFRTHTHTHKHHTHAKQVFISSK